MTMLVARFFMKRFLLTAVLGVGTVIIAMASTLTVETQSTADNPNEWNSMGANVYVVPNPVWDTAAGPWVSFAQTGANGIVLPNVPNPITEPNPNPPTASFFTVFDIPGTPTSAIFTFGADDTARIWVNGVMVADADPVQLKNCAASIGCLPTTVGVINIAPYLDLGINEIVADVYQRASSSFGFMEQGTVTYTPTPTPESSTGILLGSTLVVIGMLRRRWGAAQ